LPVVLSDHDAALYRTLFAMARQYETGAAGERLAELQDPVLVGYVSAFRYVGSMAAAADPEFDTWLASYGDLPIASRVASGLSFDYGRDYPASSEIEGSQLWAMYRAAQTPYPSSRATPETWLTGLAAWRAGDYQLAASAFESTAIRTDLSSWTQAAGAFWAARACLFAGDPDKVTPWLLKTSEFKHTFYGLLARRILGLPAPYEWSLAEQDIAALQKLVSVQGGRRAIALIEIGEYDLAERELAALVLADDVGLAHGAMIVAEAAGSADLAYKLQRMLRHYGIEVARASYPIPRWRPRGGFTTDPALVYALIRQESNFNPTAVSSAGARGVMQLMPATARFVVRRTGVGDSSLQELYRPEANMLLGQQYIDMLLNDAAVGPDLFRIAAAWNGGPGNLGRWTRDFSADADPLLFIETIPLAETRDFVERILANMWIYRHRLGQPAPSLDALAEGSWPGWDADLVSPIEVAEHGRD
jgi:soluble lytic murein transglycosylase-like protein